MKVMNCLRCGAPMDFVMREKIQLGKTGWLLGGLPNLLAGAMDVSVCRCPNCGKLEFFDAGCFDGEAPAADYPQRNCPNCGIAHDFDYPNCPNCGYRYPEFQ